MKTTLIYGVACASCLLAPGVFPTTAQHTAPDTQPAVEARVEAGVEEDGPPKWTGYAKTEAARARVQRELDARWYWDRMTIAELQAEVAEREQTAFDLAIAAYQADPRLREAELRYREVKRTLDDHTQAFLTAESTIRSAGAPMQKIRSIGRDRMTARQWAEPIERAFWTDSMRSMVGHMPADDAQLDPMRDSLAEAGHPVADDAGPVEIYIAAFEMNLKDPAELDAQLRQIAAGYGLAWRHVDVIADKGGWVATADYTFGIMSALTPAEVAEAHRLADLAGKALRNRRFQAERAAEPAEQAVGIDAAEPSAE
ncbi:MAG: hypothetical protein AAF288_02710 [Planctomycetota bacterium]